MIPRMTRLLTSGRTRSIVDLVIVLVLVEVWLWSSTAKDLYRVYAGAVIALIVFYSFRRRSSDAWKTDRPLWSARFTWIVVLAMTCALGAGAVLAAELLYIEGEQLRSGRLERALDPRGLAGKGLIVILQQFGLYHFFFPSFLQIFRSRTIAIGATAVAFGALHLPGVVLVGLTAAMAVIWLHVFARCQRLVPLIASHLALAVVANAVFPERLTYNFAVGRNAVPIAQGYGRLAEGPLAARFDEFRSNAYYEKNGNTDRAFIVALYRDVLQRAPAEAEIGASLSMLRRRSRAEVVMRFLTREFPEVASPPR
jgi:hypothetical protein